MLRDLDARDRALADAAAGGGEVVLWFEHDLYDQLQLLQLLDRLADAARGRVSLVCIGAFPGVEPFYGLGQLSPAQLASLHPGRAPVADAQWALARAAWAAFRAPDPVEIERVLAGDTDALPFLRGALLRHLEQFPAADDGLSRTERQLLEAAAGGAAGPRELFLADQAREEAVFMGDTTLWSYVAGLAAGPEPLLRVAAGGRSACRTARAPAPASGSSAWSRRSAAGRCWRARRTGSRRDGRTAGWAASTCAAARRRGAGTARRAGWSARTGSRRPSRGSLREGFRPEGARPNSSTVGPRLRWRALFVRLRSRSPTPAQPGARPNPAVRLQRGPSGGSVRD